MNVRNAPPRENILCSVLPFSALVSEFLLKKSNKSGFWQSYSLCFSFLFFLKWFEMSSSLTVQFYRVLNILPYETLTILIGKEKSKFPLSKRKIYVLFWFTDFCPHYSVCPLLFYNMCIYSKIFCICYPFLIIETIDFLLIL